MLGVLTYFTSVRCRAPRSAWIRIRDDIYERVDELFSVTVRLPGWNRANQKSLDECTLYASNLKVSTVTWWVRDVRATEFGDVKAAQNVGALACAARDAVRVAAA